MERGVALVVGVLIMTALLIHGVNRHFVWRAASALSRATDRKKAKKRHLTEGMTEKTLTYLTVLLLNAVNDDAVEKSANHPNSQ
jgi:hypothetical protein